MLEALQAQPVTSLLIGASVAVSLWAFSQQEAGRIADRFLFEPFEVREGRNIQGLFLSQFSHADAKHLIFNMISLYFFGPAVEAALGPARMLLVYALSAAGATLLTYAVHKDEPGYRALGASGAISGILFAAIVLDPGMSVFIAFLPMPIPGPIFAIGYVLISIFAAKRRLGNVGHEAHLGGAITGFALAGLLSPAGFAPLLSHFGNGHFGH